MTVRDVEPGWEDRWREFHRPVYAGGLWIGPPWETVPPGTPAVVVDPGRAFGTGAHATTWQCIELLAEQERGSVLDIGCGSGVLAIAAARLGFAPIVAVDLDPVAIACTGENALRNGVVLDEVRVSDALRDELSPCDVAVANIELEAVETVLARLRARRVIASGYLAGEVPSVAGWEVVSESRRAGWAAHVLAAS